MPDVCRWMFLAVYFIRVKIIKRQCWEKFTCDKSIVNGGPQIEVSVCLTPSVNDTLRPRARSVDQFNDYGPSGGMELREKNGCTRGMCVRSGKIPRPCRIRGRYGNVRHSTAKNGNIRNYAKLFLSFTVHLRWKARRITERDDRKEQRHQFVYPRLYL